MKVTLPLRTVKTILSTRKSLQQTMAVLAHYHGRPFTRRDMLSWLDDIGIDKSYEQVKQALKTSVLLKSDGQGRGGVLYTLKDKTCSKGTFPTPPSLMIDVPLVCPEELRKWWVRENVEEGNIGGLSYNASKMGVSKGQARRMYAEADIVLYKRKCYITADTEAEARSRAKEVFDTPRCFVKKSHKYEDSYFVQSTSLVEYVLDVEVDDTTTISDIPVQEEVTTVVSLTEYKLDIKPKKPMQLVESPDHIAIKRDGRLMKVAKSGVEMVNGRPLYIDGRIKLKGSRQWDDYAGKWFEPTACPQSSKTLDRG